MNHQKKASVGLMLFVGLGLSGCNSFDVGHYQGKLLSGHFPSENSKQDHEPFTIQAETTGKHAKSIKFLSREGRELFSFLLSKDQRTGFQMEIPSLRRNFRLKKAASPIQGSQYSNCLFSEPDMEVLQCWSDRDFYFALQDPQGQLLFEVRGGVFSKSEHKVEEPRDYQVSELLDLAMNKSFQSMVEYESMLQATYSAWNARANLLPHFRAFNAIGLLTLAPPVLLTSLADWFPFLLPNRWMMALDSGFQARAAQMGFSVMQANLAAQVHSLAYAWVHSGERLKVVEEYSAQLDRTIAYVSQLRDQKGISQVSLNSLKAYREALDITQVELKRELSANRSGLSEALGLFNPQGVSHVLVDDHFPDIVDGTPVIANELFSLANGVALERRQLHFLKRALLARTLEITFNWMDPTGSPLTALGFNQIPQGLAAQSKMNVLEIEELKFEQKLRMIADQIQSQTRGAQQGFREALEAIEQSKLEMAEISRSLLGNDSTPETTTRNDVTILQFLNSFRGILSQELAAINYRERWNLAFVRSQRLLYTALYRQLLSRPDGVVPFKVEAGTKVNSSRELTRAESGGN